MEKLNSGPMNEDEIKAASEFFGDSTIHLHWDTIVQIDHCLNFLKETLESGKIGPSKMGIISGKFLTAVKDLSTFVLEGVHNESSIINENPKN